jgi:hypothetical protein
LEGKLTDNRIRCCGHVSRMNKGRIPKRVLTIKVKCTTGKKRCYTERRNSGGIPIQRQRSKERLGCLMAQSKCLRKKKNYVSSVWN